MSLDFLPSNLILKVSTYMQFNSLIAFSFSNKRIQAILLYPQSQDHNLPIRHNVPKTKRKLYEPQSNSDLLTLSKHKIRNNSLPSSPRILFQSNRLHNKLNFEGHSNTFKNSIKLPNINNHSTNKKNNTTHSLINLRSAQMVSQSSEKFNKKQTIFDFSNFNTQNNNNIKLDVSSVDTKKKRLKMIQNNDINVESSQTIPLQNKSDSINNSQSKIKIKKSKYSKPSQPDSSNPRATLKSKLDSSNNISDLQSAIQSPSFRANFRRFTLDSKNISTRNSNSGSLSSRSRKENLINISGPSSARKAPKINHIPSPFRDFVFTYLQKWTGCRQLSQAFEENRSRGLEWRMAALLLIDRHVLSKTLSITNKSLNLRWDQESLFKKPLNPDTEQNAKKWIGVFGNRYLVEMTNLWHYAISLSQRGYQSAAVEIYNKCIRITIKQWKSTWNRLELQKYNERMAYLHQGMSVSIWCQLQKDKLRKEDPKFDFHSYEETKKAFEDSITRMITHFIELFKDPFLKNMQESLRIILISAYVRLAQFHLEFSNDVEKSLNSWKIAFHLTIESKLDLVLYQVFLRMQIAHCNSYIPESINESANELYEILSDYRQDLDVQWVLHLLFSICLVEIMKNLTIDLSVFRNVYLWNEMCIKLHKTFHSFSETVSWRFSTSWQLDSIDSIIDSIREVSLSNFDHSVNNLLSNCNNLLGSDLNWINRSLKYIRERLRLGANCNMRFISDEEMAKD